MKRTFEWMTTPFLRGRKRELFIGIAFLFTAYAYAQEGWMVSGVVTDADDGLPLPSVTITIQGIPKGTVTDIDGKFSLQVPKGKSIAFSYVGYKTQTIPVKSNQTFAIRMEPDALMLDEVVAVGYGSLKKSDVTAAIASVKADQLQKTPASGMDQALQGRVAGVTINANSGQPGGAAEVRIRGIGTVNNSAPIYVVDGVITEDISFLSPNDIVSTEVLKDASATAIFGSRGANGVILVTTLKGDKGKTKISFNSYVGVQNRWKKLDLMKRDEFAKTYARINSDPTEIQKLISHTGKIYADAFNDWMQDYKATPSIYYPSVKSADNPGGVDYASIETDWQDEVFVKNAMVQNYHVSLSGGNDKDNYAFSASYFNQDGTIIGSSYERLTLRMNSSHKVREWLKIGENLSFVNSIGRNGMAENAESPGASILSAAIAMAPWDPTHFPSGATNSEGASLSGQISASTHTQSAKNPLSLASHIHPENLVERWFGDVYVEIMPIKGLSLRSSVSIDLANNQNRTFQDDYRYSGFDYMDRNHLSIAVQKYKTLSFDNILTYAFDIDKHSVSIMGGQTTEEYNFYGMTGSGFSILNPIKQNWYIANTTQDKSPSNDAVERNRMVSVLGRLHYSYGDRYLATLNFRADGSNKFPESPWGYFPSFALAWRTSEEAWFKEAASLDAFEFLKMRLGWGQIGNEKVNSNAFRLIMFQNNLTFVGYPFGSLLPPATGATLLNQINKGGRWEYTEQWNVGIDAGLFKGLLNVTLDGFIRDTHDMILSVKGPAYVGNRFDAVKNVGTVRNQGIELTLDHQHKIQGVTYSLGGNVSFIKNELTALNGGFPVYTDKAKSDEGLSLFTFWGYKYEGVYTDNEEANSFGVAAGDARYRDISGAEGIPDGKINDYDKTSLGSPFPWLTYGLNANVEFKGFDLQIFFQGVYGNQIYNAMRHRTEGLGSSATLSTAMRDVYIDYSDAKKTALDDLGLDWTKLVNTSGTIPNPKNPMNDETSSRFIESGAYLRLKNIQLGYTLPKYLTQRLDVQRCRLYLSASNLLTLTGYTGYDPEIGSGVDYGNYPQARTVMFGINLDF